MSANSKPKQPTASSLLLKGKAILDEASVKSSGLDSELLLAHTLDVDRIWLRTHDTDPIPRREELLFLSLIDRRSKHEPVAYLTGSKEFYGYEFQVTRDTLIPRPESEAIITFLIQEASHLTNPSIIDVGTGSGALGISAKLKIPTSKVLLTDISHLALDVARKNADKHAVEVGFVKTNLLDRLDLTDNTLILANLPYVNKEWNFLSKELAYEPSAALFANSNGLDLIFKLIDQVSVQQASNITIFIESDDSQQGAIETKLNSLGFKVKNKSDFVIVALKV